MRSVQIVLRLPGFGYRFQRCRGFLSSAECTVAAFFTSIARKRFFPQRTGIFPSGESIENIGSSKKGAARSEDGNKGATRKGDVDETFRKAVEAGATEKRPLEDMFWGDRTGSVLDPFGHSWDLATHRKDVPPEEMNRRGKEFFKTFKTTEGEKT